MAITYTRATGLELSKIVDKIETAVDGNSADLITMACLIIAIVSQKPTIPAEKLQESVKGVSEWLAVMLDDTVGSIN